MRRDRAGTEAHGAPPVASPGGLMARADGCIVSVCLGRREGALSLAARLPLSLTLCVCVLKGVWRVGVKEAFGCWWSRLRIVTAGGSRRGHSFKQSARAVGERGRASGGGGNRQPLLSPRRRPSSRGRRSAVTTGLHLGRKPPILRRPCPPVDFLGAHHGVRVRQGPGLRRADRAAKAVRHSILVLPRLLEEGVDGQLARVGVGPTGKLHQGADDHTRAACGEKGAAVARQFGGAQPTQERRLESRGDEWA